MERLDIENMSKEEMRAELVRRGVNPDSTGEIVPRKNQIGDPVMKEWTAETNALKARMHSTINGN